MGMMFPPDTDTTRQAAHAMLDHGWSVIPIERGGKRPNFPLLPKVDGKPSWLPFQDRRAEWEELEDWFERDPQTNIGVVTGAISNLAVVDIDDTHGGRQSVTASGIELPKSLLSRTPHGWHLYYSGAEGLANRAGIMPGVDIRAEGGYVVAAPSTLVDGVYRWIRRVETMPFPSALVLMPPPVDPDTLAVLPPDSPGWVTDALKHGASFGQRNAVAAKLAGYFHSKGHPLDIIRTLLEPFRLACKPPMDERELDTTAKSVTRYAQRAVRCGVLDPPDCVPTRLGHRYSWPSLGIVADYQAVQTVGNQITAEVTIEAELPGVPERLHGPVRVDLLSTSHRAGMVRYLKARHDADWAELLEQTARMTIEAHRSGEPAVLLRDAVPPTGGQWALEPLVLATDPTIWFADGGTAKSFLALAAACALSVDGFTLAGIETTRRRRVLFLDWEWDAYQHRRRLEALLGGRDLDVCDLLYRRCVGPLTGQADTIARLVATEAIEYVIIDSVGAACGDEPERAAVALGFANAVRSLNVGSLWIAHTTKNGGENQDKPFGSTYWFNAARAIWQLKKEQTADSDTLVIGMYHRKGNTDKLQRPVGVSLTFERDRVFLDRADVRQFAALAPDESLQDRIYQALSRGAATVPELAQELGERVNPIRIKLTNMQTAGVACRIDDLRWGLVTR